MAALHPVKKGKNNLRTPLQNILHRVIGVDGDATPDQELILLCSRRHLSPAQEYELERLLRPGLDWERIISAANFHRVTPLLLNTLSRQKLLDRLPFAAVAQMQLIVTFASADTFRKYQHLERVLRLFSENGIRVAVLKGAALASSVYADESLRGFADLDLLISPFDLQKAKVLMKEFGATLVRDYYSVPDERNEELGCEWTYVKDNEIIEVHWNLAEKTSPYTFSTDELLGRAVKFDLHGNPALCLSREDELINLCVHQHKHHWNRLRDLCDINEIIVNENHRIDWCVLLDRTWSAGAEKCVYYTLLLARNLLRTPLPEEVLGSLDAKVQPGALRRSLFELIQGSLLSTHKPHGFWPIIFIEGYRERAHFIIGKLREVASERRLQETATGDDHENQKTANTIIIIFKAVFQYSSILLRFAKLLVRNAISKQ